MTTTASKYQLYPYQEEDILELIDRPRVILGSVMRAGKMCETFELVKRLDLQNALVICPNPVVPEWLYKIEDWLGRDWLKRFDVYNFEKIRDVDFVNLLNNVGYELVVLDEAHKIKNRKAQQTLGAFELSEKARRLILASGTPIENHPGDAWSLLHAIDPALFSSYWKFVEHFCIVQQLPRPPYPRIIRGARSSTKQELKELLAKYMLRREKYELLDHEGRPIILDRAPTRTIPIELTDSQLLKYQSMEDKFFAMLDNGEMVDIPKISVEFADGSREDIPSPTTMLLRLRQLCLEPNLLLADKDAISSSPGAKTEAILDILEDADSPIVIATTFQKYARLLTQELQSKGIRAAEYSGAPDIVPIRHQTKQDFQEGKYDALVVTIQSFGLGLTATASHIMILADQHWNPQVMDQCISRLEGSGPPRQTKPVEVIDMWCKGTVEDSLHGILARKTKMFRDIVVREKEVWDEVINHRRLVRNASH